MQERTVKISVNNLTKRFETNYGRVTALQGVTLDIRDGEFFAIVGPSGCGKSTLLRIMAGLEEETSGDLAIWHEDPKRPLTSMVFQEQSVFPWMTVRNNIAYGLRMRGMKRREWQPIVDHYLRLTGLAGFANAYPHQLSGGMKQRVSLARAFANDPEILLMDEPFAALDEQNKLLLQEELLRIWEGTGKTVVYITHSIDEALNLADRVLVMTAHPGRPKAVIENDLPRPRNLLAIRKQPRFTELFTEVWEALREEVLRAKEEAQQAAVR